MRKHLMICIPMLLLLASCSSRRISRHKVPSVVLNTLQARYSNATNAQWEKDGILYEAEFDLNDGLEVTARIDETGKLLMEKQDVAVGELSREVLSVLQNLYKGYTIDDAEKVHKNGIVYYQIELDGKGKKDTHLVFSAMGKEEKNTPYWD
jgi:hypothetical protein